MKRRETLYRVVQVEFSDAPAKPPRHRTWLERLRAFFFGWDVVEPIRYEDEARRIADACMADLAQHPIDAPREEPKP